MRLDMLEMWLRSPKASRRRKAIQKLRKEALRNVSLIDKYFDQFIELVNDEDWAVRAASLHSCIEFSKVKKNLTSRVLPVIKEKVKDPSPNVRAIALRGLSELLTEDMLEEFIYDAYTRAIKDENNDVRIAALELAKKIAKYDADFFVKHVEEFLNTLNSDAVGPIKEKILEIFADNIDKLDEKMLHALKDAIFKNIKHRDFAVRVACLRTLSKMYELGKIDENELRTILRKRLRDEAIPVKIAAIELIEKIIDKNARFADNYLDIISKEILRKEKNLRLKLRTLEMLDKTVDKIPTEIVNKHELPRTLDILDKLTVEKREELRKIKMLARHILEEKLGFTFEKRRKLWGSKEIRKTRKFGSK